MRKLVLTKRFDRELVRVLDRGLAREDWEHLAYSLAQNDLLPDEYDEHLLHGRWKGHIDCHLSGDLIVVYRRTKATIVFASIGTHVEVFRGQPKKYQHWPKQRPKEM